MKYGYHKPYSRFPDPGELNKRVLFYTQQDEPIGDSGIKTVKKGKCTVWGKLIPVSDILRINSIQINKKITHKIIVRYRKSLYDSSQAFINGIVYSIRGVIDINSEGRFLSFSCEEMRSQELPAKDSKTDQFNAQSFDFEGSS